jgi:hypothetical protein
MCDRDKRTCFDCRVAGIDPGSPDVFYLSNGDPGYPGEPAYAMCRDPMASQMADEFEEICTEADRAIRNAIWKNTAEYNNCEPGEEMRLPFNIKQSIEYRLRTHSDFAPFCPMFQQRTYICQCCKKEYPINEGEFYCKECEDGIKAWEKEHEEELSKNIWYPPQSDEDMNALYHEYEACCAKDLQDDRDGIGD